MKSRMSTKFSNYFLLSVIGFLVLFNPFIVKAQKSSTPVKLDYTEWQAIISFQDKTGYLRTIEFSYFLTERGKAKVIIVSKMSGTQSQKEYDVASGNYIYVPRYNPLISSFSEVEIGTFSQKGNSIYLEFPSHKVEAAIAGNYASGNIFPNFGDKQKLGWTAEKILGESNVSSGKPLEGSRFSAPADSPIIGTWKYVDSGVLRAYSSSAGFIVPHDKILTFIYSQNGVVESIHQVGDKTSKTKGDWKYISKDASSGVLEEYLGDKLIERASIKFLSRNQLEYTVTLSKDSNLVGKKYVWERQ